MILFVLFYLYSLELSKGDFTPGERTSTPPSSIKQTHHSTLSIKLLKRVYCNNVLNSITFDRLLPQTIDGFVFLNRCYRGKQKITRIFAIIQ